MERLTQLDKYGHPYTNENINCRNLVSEDGITYKYVGYVDNFKAFDGKPIDKLSKLEDIEQELGIPLELLFKALKDGIYRLYEEFEDEPPYIYYLAVDLCYDDANEKEWCLVGSTNTPYYLKDYGKTWALTREELE